MSDLLETAIAEVRRLSEADQARAAELLLVLAAGAERDLSLSPEQIAGVEAARKRASADKFADEEVAAFFRRIGLS